MSSLRKNHSFVAKFKPGSVNPARVRVKAAAEGRKTALKANPRSHDLTPLPPRPSLRQVAGK